MKKIIVLLTFCLSAGSAFTQNTATNLQNPPSIKVPSFADPVAMKFYTTYSNHLIKCIKAIREKNEAKTLALFKDPGKQLVEQEKIISKETIKNPVEKQKYIEWTKNVYPYIKEVEHSAYYIKAYGKK